MTQKITPFLWFDHQAEEALTFYVSLFESTELLEVARKAESEPGAQESVLVASCRLAGLTISGINGGPAFSITPAVSFFVECESEEQVDRLWSQLIDGGTALMELEKYPFSDKYGWVQDRYGVSWQLNLTGKPQTVVPFLTFVGDQFGRAEEAITYYRSVFKETGAPEIHRYGPGTHEPENAVVHGRFTLAGQPFIAMESSLDHDFTFTEGTSFAITCEDQAEVDYYWDALTDGGEPGQCGWLKDKFGLSWQVVPRMLPGLLLDRDPEKAGRVMEAMMPMQKLDIATLQEAYASKTRAGVAPGA